MLNGTPRLDYLHMVDLRNQAWRDEKGISWEEAERRIDAAFDLIDGAGGLFPVAGLVLDTAHMLQALESTRLLLETSGGIARRPWVPDFLCFFSYAKNVLAYVSEKYPDADKVDFIIERNGRITHTIERFYDSMPSDFREMGYGRLADLMGDLIPAGKERVPLQAADLLCWYSRASKLNMLNDPADERRYQKLSRRLGIVETWTDEEIVALSELLAKNARGD